MQAGRFDPSFAPRPGWTKMKQTVVRRQVTHQT